LPFWLKVLLGGLFAVGLISLLAKYYFFYHDGNQALWTLCQFSIGLAMVCGAQLLTTLVATRADSDFSLLDGLTRPIEVWRPTFENLSEGYRRLCSLCWGVMAAVMALAVIGGIDYVAIWGEVPPPRKEPEPKTLQEIVGLNKKAAKQEDGEAGDLAEALSDLEDEAPLPTPDRPLDCVVYGYMRDGRRDFGRLLLAAKVRGKWQHVAVISADDVPVELRGDLAQELSSLEREKPLVMGPFSGVWVEPDLRCEVSFDEWDGEQSLVDPALVGMPARPVRDGDNEDDVMADTTTDTPADATADAASDVPAQGPAGTGDASIQP
jgi:hypothetical protein